MRTRLALALALTLLVSLSLASTAGAAESLTVGSGHKPGLAVTPGGTAYLAWYGPESGATSLQFCRLPRGATTCAGQRVIDTDATSLSRPLVIVNGSTVRVVQHRYGFEDGAFDRVLEYTSTDGGNSFDAGHVVGSITFDEAIPGPGSTVTAVTLSTTGGLYVQNMPMDGGSAGENAALLSTDHLYDGSVALVDAATPLAVFTSADNQGQFRRYGGSGDLNDAASWTPAQNLGFTEYPRLTTGPRGLFMLSGTPASGLEVRHYTGTTFGAPVVLTDNAEEAQAHITQDAAGRLQVVYPQYRADGIHLVHAVSDDGVNWRSGSLLIDQSDAFQQLRVAAAPDHVGVAAWESGPGSNQVRVAALGPEAPVDPVPAPPAPPVVPPVAANPAKPKAKLPKKSVKLKRLSHGRVRVTTSGKLSRPTGVSAAQGCHGKVTISVFRGKKRIARKTAKVKSSCRYGSASVLTRKKVKKAKKLKATLRFGGNAVLAAVSRSYTLKLR